MSSLLLSALFVIQIDGKPTLIHHVCGAPQQSFPVINYEDEEGAYILYRVECYDV